MMDTTVIAVMATSTAPPAIANQPETVVSAFSTVCRTVTTLVFDHD
ncbi:MAG: hypothetical protein HPM95_03890 [Alphaproteobacteria bacterium]|nr:hypothetical protein [Alphaproteobacteria bacterium]